MILIQIQRHFRVALASTVIAAVLLLFGFLQIRYFILNKVESVINTVAGQSGCSVSHTNPMLEFLAVRMHLELDCPHATVKLKHVVIATTIGRHMLDRATVQIKSAQIKTNFDLLGHNDQNGEDEENGIYEKSPRDHNTWSELQLRDISITRPHKRGSYTAFIKRATVGRWQARQIQTTITSISNNGSANTPERGQQPAKLEVETSGTLRMAKSIDRFTLRLSTNQRLTAGSATLTLIGSPGSLSLASTPALDPKPTGDKPDDEHRAKLHMNWQHARPLHNSTDTMASLQGNFHVSLHNFATDHALLADEPVVWRFLELHGPFTADLSSRKLTVPSFQLTIANSHTAAQKLRLHGSLALTDAQTINHKNNQSAPQRELKFKGYLPHTSCETIRLALPAQMLGPLHDFTFSGSASGEIKLVLHDAFNTTTTRLHRLSDDRNSDLRHTPANGTDLDIQIRNPHFTCHGIKQALQYSKEFLSRPFTIARPNKDIAGDPIHLFVHPDSQDFVALPSISRSLIAAIILSEDRGFWTHKGIDFHALEKAFITNVSEQKFARGGSTITMQTAKNLFLSHKKTMSRKIQELFLAKQLEHHLSKQRILEIYLNIIEFGPNIFGIKKASEVYFDKHPYNITPAEAAFLATLLPNPKERYHSYCHGSISPGMRNLSIQVLERMKNFQLLNPDYEIDSEVHQVRFAKGAWQPNPCFKISQSQ